MDPDDILQRLLAEKRRIERAALAAGRDPREVKLLAVSKGHGPDAIRAAYAAGQRDFGENYVQELVDKAERLSDLPDLRFHMIGHLQTNKARQVVGHVASVQTVDSVKLVVELGRRVAQRGRTAVASPGAAKARESSGSTNDPGKASTDGAHGREEAPSSALPLDVLVEINVSGEEQKSGARPEDAQAIVDAIAAEPHLRLRGLLTVPPHSESPEEARSHFLELVRLQGVLGGKARLPELSMGMSADLEVAVAAGSTWVRIGTAIFGTRAPRVGSGARE